MSDITTCALCPKEAEFICPNCLKAGYCSPAHQQEDTSAHADICFPAEKNEEHGYISTREICSGEKLYVEKPFLVGPGYENFYFVDNFRVSCICIGCYQELYRSACDKCETCGMLVCKMKEKQKRQAKPRKCENEYWHKKFECSLINDLQVQLFAKINHPIVYYYITIVRFLLLKKENPGWWQSLEEKFPEAREGLRCEKLKNKAKRTAANIKKLFKGIEKECGLPFENIIDAIAAIYRYKQTTELSSHIFCTALYTRTDLFSHGCSPNTGEFHRCTDVASLRLESIAFQFIPKNTRLTHSMELGLITLGTDRRQQFLQNIYEIKCKCERCEDRTEFGTFFTGVKCSGANCKGYFLLGFEAPNSTRVTKRQWKCNCCFKKKFIEINGELSSDRKDAPQSADPIADLETRILFLKGQLHANHYTIFHVQKVLLQELCIGLNSPDEAKKIENATKMISICGQQFSLVNSLCPGQNPLRGRLLFFFTQALRCFTTNEYIPDPVSPAGQMILHYQERARKEAVQILRTFPDCFEETKFSSPKMIRLLGEPDHTPPKHVSESDPNEIC